MVEASDQLLIRFRGICAHIDLPNGKKRKRTVLVRHRNGDSGIEHHVPYIEFFADDVNSFPRDMTIFQYSKPGVDGRFARVDLDDTTEIKLNNLIPGEVEEELNYKRDVTHMSEILSNVGQANSKVATSLTGSDPKQIDRNRAAAVFDMPKGRLIAGEPEALITRFPKEVNFEPRRMARWTDLYVTCKSPVVLQLTSLSTEHVREISFKKTLRMLTIGNEPERLILGIMPNGKSELAAHGINHGSADDVDAAPLQPTGHYVLYYDLLENPPESRPVPIPTQLTGGGCINNNYP